MKYLVFSLWFMLAAAAAPAKLSAQTTRPHDENVVVLITQEEAALNSPKKNQVALASKDSVDDRAITRNPKIFLVSPNTERVSPELIHFEIKFLSFNGAQIDPKSVKVTYLAQSPIDLTPRVTAFIRSNGIDIPRAQVAGGKHLIQVDVVDTEGREASTQLTLNVAD